MHKPIFLTEPDHFSSPHLFLRSLTPSLLSGVICLLASILLVALHVLLISLHLSTFLPGLLSDQWILGYTDFVIRPISNFLNNRILNTTLTAALWGVLGLVVYSCLEFAINSYHEWRSEEEGVLLVGNQTIIRHPLRRLFVVRALWRTLVGMCTVILTVSVQPLFFRLLTIDNQALNSTSVMTVVYKFTLTVLAWAFLIHCYIILLRLYVLRTRVFGEIIR